MSNHSSKAQSMKICDIAQIIEEFAPLSLQAEYDNSGLVVGRMDDEVCSALLAVDVTEEVIDEAIEHGCDIIITLLKYLSKLEEI